MRELTLTIIHNIYCDIT